MREFWIDWSTSGHNDSYVTEWKGQNIGETFQYEGIHAIEYGAYSIALQKLEDKKEECRQTVKERDEYKADNNNWDRLYLEQSKENERLKAALKEVSEANCDDLHCVAQPIADRALENVKSR